MGFAVPLRAGSDLQSFGRREARVGRCGVSGAGSSCRAHIVIQPKPWPPGRKGQRAGPA
jgi:hypothetical protein